MSVLPDVLDYELKLVFCGTAASAVSARQGAYYANPSNYFWRTLYRIGLTPHQLEPAAFRTLTDYSIGLTDMAKHASGMDRDLSTADYDRAGFERKIQQYQPLMVAFTSKKAASVYFQCQTSTLKYGLQTVKIGNSSVWVLTSPSGAARAYWDESVWMALAKWLQNHS